MIFALSSPRIALFAVALHVTESLLDRATQRGIAQPIHYLQRELFSFVVPGYPRPPPVFPSGSQVSTGYRNVSIQWVVSSSRRRAL